MYVVVEEIYVSRRLKSMSLRYILICFEFHIIPVTDLAHNTGDVISGTITIYYY